MHDRENDAPKAPSKKHRAEMSAEERRADNRAQKLARNPAAGYYNSRLNGTRYRSPFRDGPEYVSAKQIREAHRDALKEAQ